MSQRQNMSGYTSEDIENAILSGIVKTLQIMKDVREEGDDLNSIDFDEDGVCNYCKQIESLSAEYGTGEAKGEAELLRIFDEIKKSLQNLKLNN